MKPFSYYVGPTNQRTIHDIKKEEWYRKELENIDNMRLTVKQRNEMLSELHKKATTIAEEAEEKVSKRKKLLKEEFFNDARKQLKYDEYILAGKLEKFEEYAEDTIPVDDYYDRYYGYEKIYNRLVELCEFAEEFLLTKDELA